MWEEGSCSGDMQGPGYTMEPRGTAAGGRIPIAPCSSCSQGHCRKGICPHNTLLSYAHAHTHKGAQRHNAWWGNPSNPLRDTSPCPGTPKMSLGRLHHSAEQEPQSTLGTFWKHILTWMSVYIELNNKWY